MLYIKQDDFDEFKCIADKCPKSCCKCWQIVIDDEALVKYASYKGDFSKRLKAGIDFKEGVFLQKNGNCQMLGENDLCDLQCALGEDGLCYTCKLYPRHIEEFEDVREYTLSLSCPEAARMAVQRIKPMTFIESEDDEEDDFEDFDYFLYSKLVDARDAILKEIQFNKEKSIVQRMGRILAFAKNVQNYVEEGKINEIDDLTQGFFDDSNADAEEIDSNIDILYSLERLNESWKGRLDRIESESKLVLTERETRAAEQILVLLIYTYFCGGVYDCWIYSKAALAIYSTFWIFKIYKGLTEEENLDTLTDILVDYSREIEHSDLNLNALEEYFSGI